MSSLGRLGIGLSVVFGCFLLALVAELYYVFWWRKRLNPSGGESALNGEVEDEYGSPSRELFYLLCWKKPAPSSLSTRALNVRSQREATASNSNGSSQGMDDPHTVHRSPDQSPIGTDFVAKFFPVHAGAQGMDSEIMRIHSLLGPPRILFTIKEETKEDMDSDDGRSRGGKSKRGSRSRSLSDLLAQIGSGAVTPIDTPYVTPPSSPPFCTPLTTPPHHNIIPRFQSPLTVHSTPRQHLSPLREESGYGFSSSSSSSSCSSSLPSSFPSSFASSASHSPLILSPPRATSVHVAPRQQSLHVTQEGHFHNIPRVSSPPPKFKFLRDADGKVSSHNTTSMDSCDQQEDCHSEQPMPCSPSSSSAISISSDEDGSFITIIVGDSSSSSSSSSSHQALHPSPVSSSNPTEQTMPLFSPATSVRRKSTTDTIEKQCS